MTTLSLSLSLSYNLLKREKKTKQKEAYHIRKLDYEQEMHITFIRINCFDLKPGHFATSSIVFSLLEWPSFLRLGKYCTQLVSPSIKAFAFKLVP